MLSEKRTSLVWPVFLLILAVFSVQGGAAIAKHLFPLVGAEGATSLRLGFGALFLILFFRPWRINLKNGDLRSLIFYGISLGAMNFLFYRALKEIPIGIAVAIEFTGPLTVALFYSRRPVDFVWILLVVIGLLLLLPISEESSNVNLKGVLYALSAGFFWALYMIFGKKTGKSYGVATVSIGMLIGACLFVPIGFVKEGMALLAPQVLFMGFFVALLSSAIPFALEMAVMTQLPTKTFGTLSSLEPAVGALSGMIFLGEVLTPIQWIALVAIIGASMGATLTAKTRKL